MYIERTFYIVIINYVKNNMAPTLTTKWRLLPVCEKQYGADLDNKMASTSCILCTIIKKMTYNRFAMDVYS